MGISAPEVAQEKLIVNSGVPYTIVRATQFLEFLRGIADADAPSETQSCFRRSCFSRSRRTTLRLSSPRRRSRRRAIAS